MSRIKSSFLTLLVIFGVGLLVTSLALGGNTTFSTGDSARTLTSQRAKAGQDWQVPLGSKLDRDMAFIAGSNDFFLDLVIGQGASWLSAAPVVTVTIISDDPTVAPKVGSALSQTLITTNSTDDTIRISWDAGLKPVTSFSTAQLNFENLTFDDANNQAGAEAGIDISVFTFDAFSTNPVDVGSNTQSDFFQGGAFFQTPTVVASTATIDVNQDRKGFLTDAEDTTSQDLGATIALKTAAPAGGIFDVDGTAFVIGNGLLTQVVALFSDGASLGGITTFEGTGYATGKSRITMTAGFDTVAREVTTTVDGTSTLDTRTITASFTFSITQPDTTSKDFIIGVAITVSAWDLNGCVLVAHWVQGNTDDPGVPTPASGGAFKSRLYLVNHTTAVGAVDIEVFQADRSNGGSAPSSLGTTTPGAIPDLTGDGALVVRLEDVLNDTQIKPNLNDGAGGLPHTANGGNLAVVATVRVSDCSGSYQTFNEDVLSAYFGTANMTRIE